MNDPKKNKKKGVRVLGSDQDYLSAFLDREMSSRKDKGPGKAAKEKINRHGMPFVEDYETRFLEDPEESNDEVRVADDAPEEDFAELLAKSFKCSPPPKKIPKPVPLKKRLKRYPPPEADLDLHGFTAVGAEIKARSFINAALAQGFFTVRIIVGKGLHSQDGPVLPHVVEDLVKAMKKEKIILSYEWEKKGKKRGGALIAYLNQFKD